MPWMGCRHGPVGLGRPLPSEGRVGELGCSLRGANRYRDGRYSRSSDPVALPEGQLAASCSGRFGGGYHYYRGPASSENVSSRQLVACFAGSNALLPPQQRGRTGLSVHRPERGECLQDLEVKRALHNVSLGRRSVRHANGISLLLVARKMGPHPSFKPNCVRASYGRALVPCISNSSHKSRVLLRAGFVAPP